MELIDDLLRETIQKSVQNFENSLFFLMKQFLIRNVLIKKSHREPQTSGFPQVPPLTFPGETQGLLMAAKICILSSVSWVYPWVSSWWDMPSHYKKLATIGEGRVVDQQANRQLHFSAIFSLHHDGLAQRPHHCSPDPSVNLPLPSHPHNGCQRTAVIAHATSTNI